MPNQLISNLITNNISQANSTDRITDSEVRSVLNAINSFIQDDISYNTAIPFDKMVSQMAPHTVAGAITFTKNITGAVPGCGTILRLTSNGVNAPAFTGFKKSSVSKDYVSASGVVNVLIFFYDGVDYWYSIFQDAAVTAVIPDAPTLGVVDDTANTFNWTNNPSFTAVSDYEYTLDGGSTFITCSAKPVVVGNVAKAIGQVGVRVKSVAGNPPSNTLFNGSAFTVAAGDTTAPTVTSKNTTSSTNIRIVFSEAVNATLAGWSFKKNGSALATSAIAQVNSTTWDFTVAAMANGDALLVSYDSTTGNTVDTAGTPNELVSFTDSAVTNNIIGNDADAVAFWTASGITDSTQKSAINQLVVDIKAAGLWTGMKALYPIVGGTAATHKYNLKDAQDTDAAFRLSFLGTVTHDANGVTGNGTTGYADTFLNDNTHITGNPVTIGSYSRTNGNTGFSMGVNGTGGTYIADRNSIILRTHDTSDITVAVANQQRLIVGTRQSSGVQNMYQNGTQLSNNIPAVAGKINFKYFLMAISNSGAATGFSDKNYCFFFIYDGGMTQTEVSALNNAVNTYQTALGRNV
jgi:hypothetical protein